MNKTRVINVIFKILEQELESGEIQFHVYWRFQEGGCWMSSGLSYPDRIDYPQENNIFQTLEEARAYVGRLLWLLQCQS